MDRNPSFYMFRPIQGSDSELSSRASSVCPDDDAGYDAAVEDNTDPQLLAQFDAAASVSPSSGRETHFRGMRASRSESGSTPTTSPRMMTPIPLRYTPERFAATSVSEAGYSPTMSVITEEKHRVTAAADSMEVDDMQASDHDTLTLTPSPTMLTPSPTLSSPHRTQSTPMQCLTPSEAGLSLSAQSVNDTSPTYFTMGRRLAGTNRRHTVSARLGPAHSMQVAATPPSGTAKKPDSQSDTKRARISW